MRFIRISPSTHSAVAQAAERAFLSTGTQDRDGWWTVPVDEELFGRIQEHKLPGETDDDVIARVIAVSTKRVH